LPDMERRLIADYGFKRSGESWLPAWQLTGSKAETAPPREKPKATADEPAK
jgi:hypothetical protein